MKKRIAIFISGRGSNMEAIVKNAQSGILQDCCEVVLVFSNKPDARGLEIAQKLGVRTACIESKGKKREDFEHEVIQLLQPYHIEYIVLAGFMRILSPVIIAAYRYRIINIHPADTAQFKGLDAYKWAYEQRLQSTKITVHYVDEGVDTGQVITQCEVDLQGADTLEEVEHKGLTVEHKFYSEVLHNIFTKN